MAATKSDAAQSFNAAAKRARKRPAEAPSPHDTGPIILAQTIVGHDVPAQLTQPGVVLAEPGA